MLKFKSCMTDEERENLYKSIIERAEGFYDLAEDDRPYMFGSIIGSNYALYEDFKHYTNLLKIEIGLREKECDELRLRLKFAKSDVTSALGACLKGCDADCCKCCKEYGTVKQILKKSLNEMDGE